MSVLALMGLLPPGAAVEGSAVFEGRDLLRLPPPRAAADLRPRARDGLPGPDDVAPPDAVRRHAADRARPPATSGSGGETAAARALELLREVRIPDPEGALHAFPHQFSGGMRQRIAIAIALACRPEAARRRRAHDGARRHRPGRDHPAPRPAPARVGPRDRPHHARSRRALGDRRPCRGVLRRPRRRGAASARTCSAARATRTRAGLLDALPHPEAPATPLVAIPGAPPAPRRIPPGCAFHPRCPYALESCRESVPPLVPRERPHARLPRRPLRARDAPRSSSRTSSSSTSAAGSARSAPSPARASRSRAGQIVGLVGESGCGKSTLARAAVGMVAPLAGTIRFEGRDVRPLTRGARVRASSSRLQMVFQNPFSSLNPRRRVGEQIGEALARARSRHARRSGRRGSRSCSSQVGLPAGAARGYPHEFSGGQRQRIAIARALAANPSVIVLDEPLASLDASAQAQIANLLADARARARARSPAHLARPRDRPPRRRRRRGHVPRPDRRDARRRSELWATPLHPYSEALIGAVPARGRRRHAARGAAGRGTRSVAARRRLPLPPALSRTPSSAVARRSRRSSRLAPGRSAACWLQLPGEPPAPPAVKAQRLAQAAPAE